MQVTGRDEFPRLGIAFNEMADQLQARMDELDAERARLREATVRFGDALAATHDVDQLLRENVLVDLYPLVRKALRVGSRSYSIKKLEPLYMGNEFRSGEVTNAAASITEYARARELQQLGSGDEAQRMFDSIADYNRYDCVSTLRLRDWLLAIARQAGIEPVPESLLVEAAKAAGKVYAASPLAVELQRLAGPPDDPDRDPDHTALALAAAAIDYHDREAKTFWWGHFFRVEQPLEAVDGIMPVPDGPGIGVTLDRPFLESVTRSVEVLAG